MTTPIPPSTTDNIASNRQAVILSIAHTPEMSQQHAFSKRSLQKTQARYDLQPPYDTVSTRPR
jgi:hypothetical protein